MPRTKKTAREAPKADTPSAISLPAKRDKLTARGISLAEVALDNKILRVPLIGINSHGQSKKRNTKMTPLSTNGTVDEMKKQRKERKNGKIQQGRIDRSTKWKPFLKLCDTTMPKTKLQTRDESKKNVNNDAIKRTVDKYRKQSLGNYKQLEIRARKTKEKQATIDEISKKLLNDSANKFKKNLKRSYSRETEVKQAKIDYISKKLLHRADKNSAKTSDKSKIETNVEVKKRGRPRTKLRAADPVVDTSKNGHALHETIPKTQSSTPITVKKVGRPRKRLIAVTVDPSESHAIKAIPVDEEISEVEVKSPPRKRQKRTKVAPSAVKTEEPRFYLKFPPRRYSLQQSRLLYNFSKLAAALYMMRLPGPHWKVRVWVRNNTTTAICVTNNKESERSVTFLDNSTYYKVMIDGASVILLGSPKRLASVSDIEILTNIVDTISLEDCMVMKV